PLWWLITIFLDARAFATFVTVPAAILAGIAFVEIVLPLLVRSVHGVWRSLNGAANGHGRSIRYWLRSYRTAWALVVVPAALLGFSTVSALITSPDLTVET